LGGGADLGAFVLDQATERGAGGGRAGLAERGSDGEAHLVGFVGGVTLERGDGGRAGRAERARGGFAHEAARVVERGAERADRGDGACAGERFGRGAALAPVG